MSKPPLDDAADVLIGAKAISNYCRLGYSTTQRWMANGEIPAFKWGGSICARRSTIDRLLRDRKAAAVAKKAGRA